MLIKSLIRPDRVYRTGVIEPFYGQHAHPVETARGIAAQFLPSETQIPYAVPGAMASRAPLAAQAAQATERVAEAVSKGKKVTITSGGSKATVSPTKVTGSGPAAFIARAAQGIAHRVRAIIPSRARKDEGRVNAVVHEVTRTQNAAMGNRTMAAAAMQFTRGTSAPIVPGPAAQTVSRNAQSGSAGIVAQFQPTFPSNITSPVNMTRPTGGASAFLTAATQRPAAAAPSRALQALRQITGRR